MPKMWYNAAMQDVPQSIRRLFWDVNGDALDTLRDEKSIIERVLNNGTLADWKWLVSCYGNATIQKHLSSKSIFGRDNVRPESRRLAELILK